MEDFIISIRQSDGTEISASTEMIEEDVIRLKLGLKPKETENSRETRK